MLIGINALIKYMPSVNRINNHISHVKVMDKGVVYHVNLDVRQ